MPHELNPNWMHVYDWLDLPPADDGERDAKKWLDEFTRQPAEKNYPWLDAHALFCIYESVVYRVSGASRLGDIWLSADYSERSGYDKRVNVAKCSGWMLKEPER